MNVIAAKAIGFGEALQPGFANYASQVVENARVLSDSLEQGGLRIVSGGTDTHLFLVDLTSGGITGQEAEEALGWANIHVNRNAIPYDTKPPRVTSGLRIGTAALTSRGMRPKEFQQIGTIILEILENPNDSNTAQKARNQVAELTSQFSVPGITSDLGFPFE